MIGLVPLQGGETEVELPLFGEQYASIGLVGILGAFLGSQLLGRHSINTGISLRSFAVSLFGAVVLLGLTNLIRRGRVR